MDVLQIILESGVRFAVPLLIAALGELISQRAGVTNIGMEGYIAGGAYVAYVVMLDTGSLPLAILSAAVVGILIAAVMAASSVVLKANQVLVGFALFILAPSLVSFLYTQSGRTSSLDAASTFAVPLLSDIPLIGAAFFAQNAFYWIAVVGAIAVAVLFHRTRAGLALVASGHDPLAAASKGVRVTRTRVIAVLVAGLAGGIAGAALSVGSVGSFSGDLVNGRGLIVIAIVILGRWSIGGVVGGSLLIGMLNALQLELSTSSVVPVELLTALPWAVVLVALVVSVRWRSNLPRSL